MNVTDKLPVSVIERIYTILEEVCGAPRHWRDQFVSLHQQENYPKEYRIQGNLGFGGKFWRANGKFYVNCYPEDETPDRLAAIAEANWRLTMLRLSFL